eukprot:TRINITY_DN18241_c1_g1_i1.p1 TRINITY_DN18241_c1_g1~~TRINITY_DN18241_c1_g1_i1.p1  ORF type:complete len:738 (+),score=121.02 TRINITY_DN18241_c1_g1_i1:120-2333(+)
MGKAQIDDSIVAVCPAKESDETFEGMNEDVTPSKGLASSQEVANEDLASKAADAAKEDSRSRLQRIRDRFSKIRRLCQPYFVPLDEASGLHFSWLLSCTLFLATGLTFYALTAGLLLMRDINPEMAEKMTKGHTNLFGFLFNLWHSAGGFVIAGLTFVSLVSFFRIRHSLRGGRWVPWLLLLGTVLVLLWINILSTGIGFVARDLTNALVKKEKDEAYSLLYIYGACFAVALPVRSLQFWVTARLAILWRQWLTGSLIDSYLGHRAYYELNPNDETNTKVDNPDQRITDDAKYFTKETLSFFVSIFDCLLTFVLNIMVLWSISHALTFSLFIYSGSATLLMLLSSRKLVTINKDQLRYEADFRYGLVHIRNNAEAIAFYAGEEPEKKESDRRLGSVVTNYYRLIKWEVVISVLRRSYGYAGYFFPYAVMLPAYMRGEIDYGSFVQAKFAFSMVEYALSFVVNNIEGIAHWWAGITRLETFQASMEDINRKGEKQQAQAASKEDDAIQIKVDGEDAAVTEKAIILRNVCVETPGSNHKLVEDLSISVGLGERVLVVGPSGCGKTSVLRVASGLWRPKTGEVDRPPVGDLLFVPQRPYMLLGTLREQLTYPKPQEAFSDDQLRDVLKEVRLAGLVDRYPDLGIKQEWPRLLSLGEQQRLAFARLLLNSPQFAVLDEATSALDVATEQMLYEKLTQRGVALISVGHRPTLAAYHTQVLELQGGGKWQLIPADSYDWNAAS